MAGMVAVNPSANPGNNGVMSFRNLESTDSFVVAMLAGHLEHTSFSDGITIMRTSVLMSLRAGGA